VTSGWQQRANDATKSAVEGEPAPWPTWSDGLLMTHSRHRGDRKSRSVALSSHIEVCYPLG
jgi:hypothetical protein